MEWDAILIQVGEREYMNPISHQNVEVPVDPTEASAELDKSMTLPLHVKNSTAASTGTSIPPSFMALEEGITWVKVEALAGELSSLTASIRST